MFFFKGINIIHTHMKLPLIGILNFYELDVWFQTDIVRKWSFRIKLINAGENKGNLFYVSKNFSGLGSGSKVKSYTALQLLHTYLQMLQAQNIWEDWQHLVSPASVYRV